MNTINYFSQTLENMFSFLLPSMPSQEEIFKETPFFGVKEWKTYSNLDVQTLDVPQALLKTLEDRCPFWPNYSVKNTHLICVIPNRSLQEIYELENQKYHFPEVSDTKPANPYWILITKYPIPDTFNLDFNQQKNLLLKHHYEPPTTVEAASAIIAAKKLRNITIYPDALSTRCIEEFKNGRVTIGSDNFSSFSIQIDRSIGWFGMAGVRRF